MTKITRSTIPWAFRARFRRGGFGWKSSKLAIGRIAEALSEIRAVTRHDPVGAAEGAVLLLEKLSPALCDVDSSSGALGNATYAAVQELVPLIAKAPVDDGRRQKWLQRLHEAIHDDDPPYIESLGEHWGDLCVSLELANWWAENLVPMQRHLLQERKRGAFAFSRDTTLCYSALLSAGRHDELMQLLELDPRPYWGDLIWGARVLAARDQIDEAIRYLRDRSGSGLNETVLARFAEEQLLRVGRRDDAFHRYALLANRANSNLQTYRALAKRYPEIEPERLLAFLIDATPHEPGKWFATAKTLKLFNQAQALIWASPCDPKTLTRAARDHVQSLPTFAMQCALGALHWMSLGHGYELTSWDVKDALQLALTAEQAVGQVDQVRTFVDNLLSADSAAAKWMRPFVSAG